MKKIIIGDVKFPEQKWITDYFGKDLIWFYTDRAVIGSPYGCTIRNVISTVINQEINEIYVIGLDSNPHSLSTEKLEEYFQREQIGIEARKTLEYMFVQTQSYSLTNWINGLSSKEENIKESVKLLKYHPIIPNRLQITGYLAIESEKIMKQIL